MVLGIERRPEHTYPTRQEAELNAADLRRDAPQYALVGENLKVGGHGMRTFYDTCS